MGDNVVHFSTNSAIRSFIIFRPENEISNINRKMSYENHSNTIESVYSGD